MNSLGIADILKWAKSFVFLLAVLPFSGAVLEQTEDNSIDVEIIKIQKPFDQFEMYYEEIPESEDNTVETSLHNISSNRMRLSLKFQYVVRSSRPTATIKAVYVRPPDLPCNNSTDCSKYNTGLFLQCVAGQCHCSFGQCWIYTYDTSSWYSRITYTCGTCGQLGSECNKHTNVSCDYPGYCGIDGYCHCGMGEHRDDICIVIQTHVTLQLLFGGFFVFAFLALAVCAHQTFLSYRNDRVIFWCSRGQRRRRRTRRGQPTRNAVTIGPSKSPAFTMQQAMLENFEDDSQDPSDESPTPSSESGSIRSVSIGEAKKVARFSESTRRDSEEYVYSTDPNSFPLGKIRQQDCQEKFNNFSTPTGSYTEGVNDPSGMTTYFEQHHLQESTYM